MKLSTPQLTGNDQREALKEICSRSLASFVRRAWHVVEPSAELKWGWALDVICEHLEAVSRGEIKRLLINVPPGMMKSLLLCVFWPAWEWGPKAKPHLRYMGTAHNQTLAVRDNTKCRRLIQSDWYQNLWPIALTGDQNAKTKFENTDTGFREAMAFTSMTGSRADRVLLDDPHSVHDANSKVILKGDITEFREALPSRTNNDESAIAIIMQRLAVGDVSDVALELGYQHVCFPMRYEAGKSKWVVGAGDPRKKDGELLFPERFSLEAVEALERTLGSRATAGQLQQRPVVRGGNIIKGEWFRTYSVLPKILHRSIFGDTALKAKEANDYSVFEEWGLGADGNLYLIDMVRGKWEAPELESRCLFFWQKCKAQNIDDFGVLRNLCIEDKASGTGLIQSIKKKGGIPVRAIQRSIDKYTRVCDGLGYIESGSVYLPATAAFTSDFISEAEFFTADDSHKNDDQIDPMMDAIKEMLAGTGGVISGAKCM